MTTTVEGAVHDERAASLRLGAHIRLLRHARAMTLVQLADATDLSHPFLSQLERGLAQPSLSTLRRVAVALETSPIELIAAADAPDEKAAEVEVHRSDERLVDDGFAAAPARTLAHGTRPMHPLEVVGENVSAGEAYVHAEDEFVYVLAGAVRVDLAGEIQTLGRGDSVYYRGGVAHRWWSATGEAYRLLVVKQGPSGWRSA
ncbi:XRE family transcriptional regulator [Microbacterium sp. Gd 4-13]|uniref:helix-turn-helix domain-containing protein n=1 Tax=Microbacterium sp. Gd 4-13 TaxID=2173179 RepID=UPI000D573F60|nr:XRE family transcriptional regulator [Microbacterium sp. Gd 4-13]PVW05320.1 XRE family transcriptional regulator [Microbacterium sp. Gd 4-13]